MVCRFSLGCHRVRRRILGVQINFYFHFMPIRRAILPLPIFAEDIFLAYFLSAYFARDLFCCSYHFVLFTTVSRAPAFSY